MANSRRCGFLTTMAVLFVLLAIEDIVKPLHLEGPTTGLVFFGRRLIVVDDDEKHAAVEDRFYALGRTDAARFLFVVFTMRGRLIRMISARDMSRKERKVYQSL